jgi:hypothetical protein
VTFVADSGRSAVRADAVGRTTLTGRLSEGGGTVTLGTRL